MDEPSSGELTNLRKPLKKGHASATNFNDFDSSYALENQEINGESGEIDSQKQCLDKNGAQGLNLKNQKY